MDASILIAACAFGLSAIGFFYNLGRDTKGENAQDLDDEKLDQIYKITESINKKLDEIARWQQEVAAVHASHSEQIKTLFNRVERVEKRMEDREVMTQTLQKILEKVSN